MFYYSMFKDEVTIPAWRDIVIILKINVVSIKASL